jgi:hypothetical protein
MMKRALAAAICLAWLAAPAGVARAQNDQQADEERILKYHSQVTVDPNGWLTVREAIQVRASGKQIKRGIYRDFPVSYNPPGRPPVVPPMAIIEVLRDGKKEPFHTENRDGFLRVYAGKADVLIPAGVYTYTFAYRIGRLIGYFGDHDELYWNVTGNGWAFPIDAASAEVMLPESIRTESVECVAYTGPKGARGTDYRSSVTAGMASFQTTKALPIGEGLTICVSWPKGHVADPAAGERLERAVVKGAMVLTVPATALAMLSCLLLGL